jgi:hypothetical protein
MIRRRSQIQVYVLVLLVVVALVGALQWGAGRAPAEEPAIDEDRVVTTAAEAIGSAASHFFGGDDKASSHITSMRYVETTAGQARALVNPGGRVSVPEVPNDAPGWLVVAQGEFQPFHYNIGGAGVTGAEVRPFRPLGTFSTAFVFVPSDGVGGLRRPAKGYSDAAYDLTRFGDVVDVPGPTITQLCEELVPPERRDRFC